MIIKRIRSGWRSATNCLGCQCTSRPDPWSRPTPWTWPWWKAVKSRCPATTSVRKVRPVLPGLRSQLPKLKRKCWCAKNVGACWAQGRWTLTNYICCVHESAATHTIIISRFVSRTEMGLCERPGTDSMRFVAAKVNFIAKEQPSL